MLHNFYCNYIVFRVGSPKREGGGADTQKGHRLAWLVDFFLLQMAMASLPVAEWSSITEEVSQQDSALVNGVAKLLLNHIKKLL